MSSKSNLKCPPTVTRWNIVCSSDHKIALHHAFLRPHGNCLACGPQFQITYNVHAFNLQTSVIHVPRLTCTNTSEARCLGHMVGVPGISSGAWCLAHYYMVLVDSRLLDSDTRCDADQAKRRSNIGPQNGVLEGPESPLLERGYSDLLLGFRGTNLVGDYPAVIGACVVDDPTPQNTFTTRAGNLAYWRPRFHVDVQIGTSNFKTASIDILPVQQEAYACNAYGRGGNRIERASRAAAVAGRMNGLHRRATIWQTQINNAIITLALITIIDCVAHLVAVVRKVPTNSESINNLDSLVTRRPLWSWP
ncbi:hypothetical protein OG21DRAFT_1526316 [Imleria badia]|nr:hypothetical protein OG21DRAFT_1526316 [Imleria badia]